MPTLLPLVALTAAHICLDEASDNLVYCLEHELIKLNINPSSNAETIEICR